METDVARAMNRALEAERAAQSAIAECEQQAANMLEQARQQRRAILDRARARIVAIHARAAANLERMAVQMAGKSPATSSPAANEQSRCARALACLAARLTTEQPTDGR